MAARTHARPAVPTTFGAVLAVWLEEFRRHLDRLDALETRVYVVSLHGAGGTGAAFGERAADVRAGVAARLGLASTEIPWHASRDVIAETGFVLAAMAATAGRIAREIIDLSRPEIGELSEAGGHHRGASSTMPQKANPISCETAFGFSHLATSGLAGLLEAMRVEHQRSAGEWQIEWDALPTVIAATGGSLLHIGEALSGLVIHPDRMRENLDIDGGSIMAEAAMMALADALGRDEAHHLVYDAVRRARSAGSPLMEALQAALDEAGIPPPADLAARLDPLSYLGNAPAQVDAASTRWSRP
jgi:3-carboxy-cis,cis-muconate cycloisomerase